MHILVSIIMNYKAIRQACTIKASCNDSSKIKTAFWVLTGGPKQHPTSFSRTSIVVAIKNRIALRSRYQVPFLAVQVSDTSLNWGQTTVMYFFALVISKFYRNFQKLLFGEMQRSNIIVTTTIVLFLSYLSISRFERILFGEFSSV